MALLSTVDTDDRTTPGSVERKKPEDLARVVLDVIALIFQGVEGFIFDFPAGLADFNQLDHIVFGYIDVGQPAVVVIGFAVDDKLIVEKIDRVGFGVAVDWNGFAPLVAVASIFGVGCLNLLMGF